MGHIFVLCGPPGAGKTTLLKKIHERRIQANQLQRLTTRQRRQDEIVEENRSLEYEFLTSQQFAERLSKGNITNLIEWNGNYYATQLSKLNDAFKSDENSILLEDIPSAVALKEKYPWDVTVIFMFTANKEEILRGLDFASYETSPSKHLSEWIGRIGLKYDSERTQDREPSDAERKVYIENKEIYVANKMKRAIPDIAFIVGKIRENKDIRVLANRLDKIEAAVNEFVAITNETRTEMQETIEIPPKTPDINVAELSLDYLIRRMTAPQLWKTLVAITAVISAVAFAAYKAGTGDWP